MAQINQHEEIRCPACGLLNRVTFKYSDFGPANQERETASCANPKCEAEIASRRCLSISVTLDEA
jgi:hypothetical protein